MSPSRRSKKGKVEAKIKENVTKKDIASEEEQVELEDGSAMEPIQTTPNPDTDCTSKEESHDNGTNLKRLHPLQNPEMPCKKSHVEVEPVESQSGLEAEFGFTRSVAVKVVSVPRVDSKYEDDFHVAFAPEMAVSEESSVGSVEVPHAVGEMDACSSEALTPLAVPSKLNEPNKLFMAGDSALFAGTDGMKVVCSTPVTINFVPSLESVAEEDTSSSATMAGAADTDGVDGDSSTQQESDAHIGSDTAPSECGVDEKKHVLPTYVAATVQYRLQPVVLRLRTEERAFKQFSPRLHTIAKYILIVWTAPFAIWFAFMSIPIVITLAVVAMISGFERSWKSATDAYSEFKELLD
ncbi:hypothetical protein HDU81_003441 [Chytriomyces hyalinus]|nr:hypothetical protein HDU81_003441 [Chytriomyces hyalinus]